MVNTQLNELFLDSLMQKYFILYYVSKVKIVTVLVTNKTRLAAWTANGRAAVQN